MNNLHELAQEVITLLKNKNKTLFTAESCTGGLIATTISDISGSSEILLGGIVAYHNHIKENILNVKAKTLDEYGAVSFETVFEMASGALDISGADIVVASTGIAGPQGGTEQKPVGTVYTAILTKNDGGWAQLFSFRGSRDEIRKQTVEAILQLIIATEQETEFSNLNMLNAKEFL